MSDVAPGFDPSAIRAVAFDGYGTLFEFETDASEWYARELLERQSLSADAEAFGKTMAETWLRASPWAAHVREDGTVDREHLLNGALPDWFSTWEGWRRHYALALDAHGLDGDPVEAANYLHGVLSRLNAYPDAHEAIERLAARGLVIGLLSNADEDFLQTAISRARLRFSVVQSSESLRAYKPHRAVFEALCARLGCAPHEVLYVGDSPDPDVAGALNAGLRAAWIQRTEAPFPDDVPSPDLRLTSLAELAGIFDA